MALGPASGMFSFFNNLFSYPLIFLLISFFPFFSFSSFLFLYSTTDSVRNGTGTTKTGQRTTDVSNHHKYSGGSRAQDTMVLFLFYSTNNYFQIDELVLIHNIYRLNWQHWATNVNIFIGPTSKVGNNYVNNSLILPWHWHQHKRGARDGEKGDARDRAERGGNDMWRWRKRAGW